MPSADETHPGPFPGEGLLARLLEASPEQPVTLGRYEVVGRVGGGGMGTVYEARDRQRGVPIALKTLLVADPASTVQLKREFRAVADLAHPNLAPVYELACEEGLWFFTMERVDGIDFRRWTRGADTDAEQGLESPPRAHHHRDLPTVPEGATRPSELPPPRSRRAPRAAIAPETDGAPSLPERGVEPLREAFAALTRGILALHEAGLRHGDVKPSNVLVREDGSVVVVDFGLARPVAEPQRRAALSGTPAYMSPEQLTGGDVGPPSDWYAVGAMLYELLTGRLPFGGGSSYVDLYIKKTLQVPSAPHELLPEVPRDLSDLCMWLLRPEPELRPDGREVLAILTRDGDAVRAHAAPLPRPLFVGRDEELSRLTTAFERARQGRSTIAHVHGPSGIGKSAVVRTFLGGVRDVLGAEVFSGRCYERETVPYKAFDGIVDQLAERLLKASGEEASEPLDVASLLPLWTAELVEIFPALSVVPAMAARRSAAPARDAKELRRRAFTAFRQLLVGLAHAGGRGVALAIDDLQWADADSARLLESLVRDANRAQLLVVASFRPVDAAANPALEAYLDLARELESAAALVDVPIPPLPGEDAEQLARTALASLGEGASPARVRELALEAAGVPFFIEELARYVAATDDVHEGAEVSLESAIATRVRSLPRDERALVELVAVADTPIAQSALFHAAGLDATALPALLSARRASLVRWTGPGADDLVASYHDRIRESVLASLAPDARRARHADLARALSARHASTADEAPGPWLFDVVRHLTAAGAKSANAAERIAAAQLHLQAGRWARKTAAFPLAFECFERGIELLPELDAWREHYELALGLHTGAAEAAYLSGDWRALETHIARVKKHGRSVMDQLVAWEVEIDAFAGRHDYRAAVDTATEVLALLGVRLPKTPGDAEVAEAFRRALGALTRVGPKALAAMPDVEDPEIAAAMRIQVRVSPAAYFGEPKLLPILAANLVATSVERGLSNATPYALALFGIVLNTAGMFPISHVWGELAVKLIDRWEDRSLEAATRHVVYNLVCPWTVPLASILEPLREVFDIGRRIGDLEYASYAAHGYVHNAMYAGRPLGPLLVEATELGEQMRTLGQVNASHVHAPFEQLLKAWTGHLSCPSRLDDATFDETTQLALAASEGSRSGIFVLRVVMGLARYHFGEARDASESFEIARTYLDAGPSVWHIPILHQFAVLAACRAWETFDAAERSALRPKMDASVRALQELASHSAANFGHRVDLVEGELLRIDGDAARALHRFERAIAEAGRGGWRSDAALGHELAARCHASPARRLAELEAARTGYAEWGARAKAERLATEIRDLRRN